MAANPSFDVSTGADLQEVDNAVNQAGKEIAQRFDFKGTHCTMEFDRAAAKIKLAADDDYRLKALVDVLKTRLVKRGVPVKNLTFQNPEAASGNSVRQAVDLKQGIDADTARKIIKAIKDRGFKKVQTSIQGEEIRISSPSRDELQEVIAFLRSQDFGLELKFGNFRS